MFNFPFSHIPAAQLPFRYWSLKIPFAEINGGIFDAAIGFCRAIATMPDEVSEYKSINQPSEHPLSLFVD
jgi:hypothetical protein|tara:strand:- start:1783 stop:1992 length:210 start_codon:yes stop_codon:yes gene_type:complete